MARVTKLNHRTVQEYLDGQHGVDAVLDNLAHGSEQRAKASAPVDSGAYRDSIHIETVHTDRMVKRVVADVPYAMAVEANTGNLARALDATGGT